MPYSENHRGNVGIYILQDGINYCPVHLVTHDYKSTYLSCNVNSGVYAFNNNECDHIYKEVVKRKNKLSLLFEGTDKWMYHKHKNWYTFWPDEYVQHYKFTYRGYQRSNIKNTLYTSL